MGPYLQKSSCRKWTTDFLLSELYYYRKHQTKFEIDWTKTPFRYGRTDGPAD